MKTANDLYKVMIYLCAFLSCLVPRYIATFKISVGLDISFYTIAVVLTWIFYVKKIKVISKLEVSFFLIWFLFIVCSIWRSKKIGVWGYYVDVIVTALFYLQILLYANDKESAIDLIIRAVIAAMAIHLVIGFYEITEHKYLFEVGEFNKKYYGKTPISIFHNPNDYITFIVTLLPFAVYKLFQHKNTWMRVFYALMILSSCYMVFKSESRGAFFTLIILGVIIMHLFNRQKKGNRWITYGAVAAAICLAFMIPFSRTKLLSFMKTYRVDFTKVGSDVSRVNLLKNGFYFLKCTYGFGVGAGNLFYWLAERAVYPISGYKFIHNWYMELLATFGIVFFVIYAVWHIRILIRLFRRYDKTKPLFCLNNCMFLSFVAFSFISISSSSNIYSEWIWMYLIFVSVYSLFFCEPDKKWLSVVLF